MMHRHESRNCVLYIPAKINGLNAPKITPNVGVWWRQISLRRRREIAFSRDKAIHENARLLSQKIHRIDVIAFPWKYRNNFISILLYGTLFERIQQKRKIFAKDILYSRRIRKRFLLMISTYDSVILNRTNFFCVCAKFSCKLLLL